jgi:RNA polymerase sigma factor (sigma-70 family)
LEKLQNPSPPKSPVEALSAHRADHQLVQDVLRGDPEARERLAARLGCIGRMLNACNRAVGGGLSDEELLDLAQDTVAKVLAKLPTYLGAAALESWVFVFCRGELLKTLARRRTRAALLDDPDAQLAAPEALETSSERHEDLLRCLGKLPAADARVVILKHFEELPFAQISTRVGDGLSAIKSRYYRALVQLRECLSRAERKRPA